MVSQKESSKLKILFILTRIPINPTSDGTVRWFCNFIKPMKNTVEQIDVIGQVSDTEENYSIVNNYCNRLIIVKAINHKKYRYRVLTGWDSGKIQAYNPAMVNQLITLCSETFYDLIVLVGHGPHVYLPYLKAKHIMVAPLDAPQNYPKSDYPRTLLSNAKEQINNRAMLKSIKSYNSADSVLVVSEKDRDILLRGGVTAKILINPICVDTNEFFPSNNQNKIKFLLFTGNLNFPPNIDATLHLVNDIYSKGNFYENGIECWIAGRNPIQKIKDLEKNKGVKIFEDLPDLRPLLSESLIYVAPMRTGLGMKTKILEAMAMGKAIVGYPLTFNGIKNPEKFALISHSPDEFIEMIYDLCKNDNLRKMLGNEARKYAEDFYSLEENIKMFLNLVN